MAQTYKPFMTAKVPMSESINPEGTGKTLPVSKRRIRRVATKHPNPNNTTLSQDFSGCFQRFTVGATPSFPKVSENQDKYKHTKPASPKTPRVNDSEAHGPAGARSVKV